MNRRRFVLFCGALQAWCAEAPRLLRGRLAEGRKVGGVRVSGDDSVEAVLADERVIGMELEIEGEMKDGVFRANPIHAKPIYTRAGGKRLIVSYWCEICYIRFYKPGTCWCCQKESLLDPKDPSTPERVP